MEQLRRMIAAAEAATGTGGQERRHRSSMKERAEDKRQKVDVLEGSAHSLEQLLAMVQTLQQTCLEQQLASEWAYRSSVLSSSLLLSARVGVLVTDAQTGRALDCNGYLLESTGWERHHVIGRVMQRSYDDTMDDRVWQANAPRRRHAIDTGLVNGPDGTMVPRRLQEQYPSSMEQKRALYRGDVERSNSVWRHQLRDGFVYELEATLYVCDWTDVDDGQGGVVGRPQRVMCVVSRFVDWRRVEADDLCLGRAGAKLVQR